MRPWGLKLDFPVTLPRLQKHNLAFSTELASILTSKITLAVILRKVEFGEKFR